MRPVFNYGAGNEIGWDGMGWSLVYNQLAEQTGNPFLYPFAESSFLPIL